MGKMEMIGKTTEREKEEGSDKKENEIGHTSDSQRNDKAGTPDKYRWYKRWHRGGSHRGGMSGQLEERPSDRESAKEKCRG